MFTVSSTFFRVGSGCTVTVFGGVFTPNCKAVIGGVEYAPLDVGEDFFSFAAPGSVGSYSFTITDGVTSTPTLSLKVVQLSDVNVWKLPKRGESEMLHFVLGLLPRGFGWHIVPGMNFHKLFSALALGILKIYDKLCDLVSQMSPLTTSDFARWEYELGLPKKGLEQSTNEGRLREIFRIARQRGGCSIVHFRQLLNLYGSTYEIYEYWKDPGEFPSWVEDLGDGKYFCVLVKLKLVNLTYFRTGIGRCGDRLTDFGDKVLEEILETDKQAHVRFICTYTE
jgi:uncharacterized protein YmfQ (DUF2313 family)